MTIGMEDKRFFAIRGYMKSGTNWICRLLNLHPQISCQGEFHWQRITSQLIQTYQESKNLDDQDGLLDRTWSRLDRFIKEAMVLACDPDAIWIGDRTPSHIEPSVILGARIFDLVRDGRDILVSAAYHFFNNPDVYPNFAAMESMQQRLKQFRADPEFFRRNPDELLACSEFVRDISYHWAEAVQVNRRQRTDHADLVSMEVRYEDVHRNTELMRRRMYEFLEVDPELASPLAFNTRAGFEEERPDQFLRKGAVGDWKNYFNESVQRTFNEVAGETLVELGYVESLGWDVNESDSGPADPIVESNGFSSVESTDVPVVLPMDGSVEIHEKGDDVDPELADWPERSVIDPADIAATVSQMSRARSILAYGGLDGVVQRPMFDHDGGVFPHFAASADGCQIVDSVGRSYLDWMNGWGPVLLGYNHPEVVEAVNRQHEAGPTLSLMHSIEVEVAAKLVEMIPCAEMVAFGKNGSDAVNASLRIARAVTGRKKILQCGFHGFHEWYTCLHPQVQGMPDGLREQVEPFPYNDIDALSALLKQYRGQVAAVIMEPVNLQIPDSNYLEDVRKLTEEHQCLLIFDEMVTAFRLGNGGAQEYFGVVPDLACIGKGMANGMPLSAVVGKREYMQVLPACGFGMTFRGETYSLAAANAVLEVLNREPVCEHLANIGEQIRRGFEQLCQQVELDCRLAGPSARMTIEFHECGKLEQSAVKNLFLQECLKLGVITNGTLLPNYAHDEPAVKRTLIAFEGALKKVKQAIESGELDASRPTGGSPTGPRALVSNGFLEAINPESESLVVQGWMLLEDGAPDSVELISASGDVIAATCQQRPDLESAFPNQPTAIAAGYEAVIPRKSFRIDDRHEFSIVAKRSGRVAFRCLVVQQNVDRSEGLTQGPYSTNDGVLYI